MTTATSERRFGADRPAVPPVLELHLEEMGFLWMQRRKLLFSADVPLRRLPAHDERIAAHADGLAIGRAASRAVAEARLTDENPWIAAAAAHTWIQVGAQPSEAVAARAEALPPELHAAWREAVRWLDGGPVDRLFPADRAARLSAPALALAIEALG